MYKQNPIPMTDTESLLHHCLYFTANSLARAMTRMAEEAFGPTGLSPSHAFLLMLVTDNPGIGQKALCEQLQLAPSTLTRFIDKLAYRCYVSRRNKGKASFIYDTKRGKNLEKEISAAWKKLHQNYSKVLGLKCGNDLTYLTSQASQKLSNI